jgi:hypothetical protein
MNNRQCKAVGTPKKQRKAMLHTEQKPHFQMTKREAILLVHLGEHFPTGFDPGHVAISLGWSTGEVLGALQVCAAYGFIASPLDPDVAEIDGASLQPPPSIDELLDPDERHNAQQSRLPSFDDYGLASGEALAVMRAISDGQDSGFTEEELQAALEWSCEARLASILLQQVLAGRIGIERSSLASGEPRFKALDSDLGGFVKTVNCA